MPDELLTAALEYAAHGWCVLPTRGKAPDGRLVAHGLRDATTDSDTIRRWWGAVPDAGIGIAIPDDILVLDVDRRSGGSDNLFELEQRYGELPVTVEAETGGGGLHIWLRAENARNTTGILAAGLDTKGPGGYVVVPPSPHPTGSRYRWRTGVGLFDHDIAAAPGWLLEPLNAARPNGNGKAPEVESVIPAGSRDSTLASLAGSMRRRGMSEAAILAGLRVENDEKCQPPLPDDDVQRIARSIAGYAPAEPLGKPAYVGPPAAIEQTLAAFRSWLYLPDITPVLAVLGTVAANQLPGDPVWLGVIAPPSSAKTEILNALAQLPDIYPVATITPAALLSGTPKKEKAADSKGGLLRQMGDFGIVVLKDFGSVLSMRPDAKAEVLAALREIYDGSWTRCLGTDGGLTLHWQGKVGLVFGATPVLDSHTSVIGAMGERFVLCRMDASGDEQALRALEHAGRQTATMRQELAAAVAACFAGARPEPRDLTDDERRELVQLAYLAVRIRSTVERDRHSREIESIHGAEGPARLALTLERLLAGLDTLGVDRTTAFGVIRRVALDSVPPLRRRALEYLREAGTLTETKNVAEHLDLPTNTARRVLEDLVAYKLVQRHGQGPGKPDQWRAA